MIMELCDRHGVTCAYTSKLFFNRFTASVTVNFPAEKRREYEAKDKAIRIKHNFAQSGPEYFAMLSALRACNADAKAERIAFIDDLFTRFASCFPEGTEFRMNKVSVTFYLDDPTNLAFLIEQISEQIVKVTVPRNEREIAFLRANTDKLIQDKYYLDRYPFKVTFKASFDHGYLTSYVLNQFGADILNDNGEAMLDFERAHFYAGCSQPILYLAHFEDLFLTKIGVQELIEKVQEVVLRD